MQLKSVCKALFGKGKRKKLTAVSAVFVAHILLFAGMFSYFHSEDSVTNTLEAKNICVKLLEPNWDLTGRLKAAAMEPGMTIPKNPYAKNDGQSNLFVRIKMTVVLDNFNTEGKSNEYTREFKSNDRRKNVILDAIQMNTDPAVDAPLFKWTTAPTAENWMKDGELDVSDCNHASYYMEYDAAASTAEADDSSAKYVFYFYYITGTKNGESSLLKAVPSGGETPELFSQLAVPVYKQDWLGVFDQKFDITLEAQGIPADADTAAVSAKKADFS